MPRSRLIAALEESQYRGLSTAAQKRAFGRDDKGRGWGERRLNCDTQVPKCEGPGAPGLCCVGRGPIQGSLHCGAKARLRSR